MPSFSHSASASRNASAAGRLNNIIISNLAPDDQMPASRSLFLAVPDPDPAGHDVNPQLSARAVAQDAARPVLGRDALGQFLDGDGRRCGLLLLRRTPAARLGGGNMESRLLRPDVLV